MSATHLHVEQAEGHEEHRRHEVLHVAMRHTTQSVYATTHHARFAEEPGKQEPKVAMTHDAKKEWDEKLDVSAAMTHNADIAVTHHAGQQIYIETCPASDPDEDAHHPHEPLAAMRTENCCFQPKVGGHYTDREEVL